MGKRPVPENVRAEILALHAAGVPYSSIIIKTGVAKGTVSRIVSGKAPLAKSVRNQLEGRTDKMPPGRRFAKREAASIADAAVKNALSDEATQAATLLVAALQDPGKIKDASLRDVAVAYGIAVEKGLLLAGQATQISEERSLAYVCLDLIRERDRQKSPQEKPVIDISPAPGTGPGDDDWLK